MSKLLKEENKLWLIKTFLIKIKNYKFIILLNYFSYYISNIYFKFI